VTKFQLQARCSGTMGQTRGDEDKENLSPTNVLQQKLRASAHLLSPGVEPRLPHNSLGKQRLSPSNARLILLKALGPSPSRQALKRFVAGLSRDERKLFLDDANGTMPGSPLSGCERHDARLSALLGDGTDLCDDAQASLGDGGSSDGSVDSSLNFSPTDGVPHLHRTEFTARGVTPSAKHIIRSACRQGRRASVATPKPTAPLSARFSPFSRDRTPRSGL
jgi:hypothetical protein